MSRKVFTGKSVEEGLHGIGFRSQVAADATDKVDDVAVQLRFAEEVHTYVGTVACQVIACQIDEHHVFGVLLGVVQQTSGGSLVFLAVACASGGTCYGVDVGPSVGDAAVRFGRGTEDAEASEVEVEEVGRRIDAAQGTVEVEVVAFEPLFEAARQDHLEHVAPQAVGNGPADVGAVFVVGQCGGHFSRWVETVSREVAVHYGSLYLVQTAGLALAQHFDEHQFVVEVVEDDEVSVEDIEGRG